MSGRLNLTVASLLLFTLACQRAETRYPLVLHGGRVMDPATGLDSVRDVAIQDGKIVAISAEPLTGEERRALYYDNAKKFYRVQTPK